MDIFTKLKSTLNLNTDIAFAYLFGSQASGRALDPLPFPPNPLNLPWPDPNSHKNRK